MRHDDHELNHLLPDAQIIQHAPGAFNELLAPVATTNRYKKAFVMFNYFKYFVVFLGNIISELIFLYSLTP